MMKSLRKSINNMSGRPWLHVDDIIEEIDRRINGEKKPRRNPTKEQRESENKRFMEWNEKHKIKIEGALSHAERTGYRRGAKGNRE